MRIGFVRWISDAPSGGNLYDSELIGGLRALGVEVVVARVGEVWPAAGAADRARLAGALAAEQTSVVDGIVAVGAPDLIIEAVAAGRSVTILVHHFAADEPDLDPERRASGVAREARALQAASGVLCTSRWAAGELRRRYDLADVGVAAPGIEVAADLPMAGRTSTTPQLLSVGSLTPTKDQLTLIAALSRIADLPWDASLVGSDTANAAYAAQVRDALSATGLADRIRVAGAQVGPALAAEWSGADLLIHPSRSETYGIVVLEALARAIPAIVMAGTGSVEALNAARLAGPLAGAVVPPGQPEPLAGVLRSWLTDSTLRRTWRDAALAQRRKLPGWSDTATKARDYLRRRYRE